LTEEEFRRPPFFSGMSPGALRGALALVAVAALAITPFQAGLTTQSFTCDFGLNAVDWIEGVANPRHLIAYAIISALAVLALPGLPLWQRIGIALLISLGVEVEQAVFADGHCRMRDMVPNFIAVVMGGAVGILIHVFANRKRD
jgi:hypothetical protein